MTARAPGGSSRGADAPTRMTWTRDGVGAILIVLAAALAFRLIIAYSYPGTGLDFDLASFRGWASDLAQNGLRGFYERPGFHDYTPGYLFVLYIVGLVGQATGGIGDLIKLPAIFADVAIGWLVWSMAIELGASRRAAILAAVIAVANPVSWFDSVVWGQVDSFGVVFLLLGVRELWRDHPERAAIWTVIAALIKPQLGILIPIVAVVTIRRALWPAGGHGQSDELAAEGSSGPRRGSEAGDGGLIGRFRAWERRTDRPIRIVTTGLVGLLTAFVLCAPFGLSVIELRDGGLRSGLVEQIFKTAGGYPYVSVNAYNPWALVELDGTGMAANGGWICDAVIPNPVEGGPVCDTAFQVGPIPAILIGTVLLLAAFSVVCAVVARRPDRLTILVGVTLLAIAFFVLPTRVHERYLFPFFALGAILAAISARWLLAYIVLSVATFLNMYVVLTTIYPGNPAISDWLGIGSWIRSTTGVVLVALANLVAAIWAFLQIRPAGLATLEAEIADWDDEFEEDEPVEVEPRDRQAMPSGAAFAAAAAPGPDRLTSTEVAAPHLVREPELRRGGSRRLAEVAAQRPAAPGGSLGSPPRRADGTPRPTRPVVPHRRHRRQPRPAGVPARRAVPDALRRGLPRAHGHGVPPVLALRDLTRHLRMDAPPPGQVRDGRRHRCLGRRPGQRHERSRRAGAGCPHRTPA